jgi:hypothetical protein
MILDPEKVQEEIFLYIRFDVLSIPSYRIPTNDDVEER